ncbi:MULTISPECIES: GNAT family N-acetyltransferase [Streptomycetaceae]|uniref:GNAT family N-acetyltransferase n=1 Tax=Streptomycetaceae TaxID=2062 RepID=UPI00300ACF10
MGIAYEWRGQFGNGEVEALHAAGFGHEAGATDWWGRVCGHSLGWVCAREAGELVGFVNVVWDGGEHAFVLDTVVAPGRQRTGVGAGLVEEAVRRARGAGCGWLHVDFEERLAPFYLGSCGFTPTAAGLIAL